MAWWYYITLVKCNKKYKMSKLLIPIFSVFIMISTIHAINIPFNPFQYDLGVKILGDRSNASEIMICCHGYGHCNQIVDVVHSYRTFKYPLVGFNFPDYGINPAGDHRNIAYGSINEILPLLFLMKYYVCDEGISIINLYGFSAGGGAIINALSVLNTYAYKEKLQAIGIFEYDRDKIIQSLQRGTIILNCPLKSMAEIIALRGSTRNLAIMACRYKDNNMNPIDVLPSLHGLGLNIILHFQHPDEILSNRDDNLFIERLKKVNQGRMKVIIGNSGGHNAYHVELWDYYKH